MLKFDCHIHTVLSQHAFATFYEVMDHASKIGIEMVAITDHGPEISGPGITNALFCTNRGPKELHGVKILWGVEANIIDKEGNIDVNKSIIKQMDIVLAQFHMDVGEKITSEEMTVAIKKTIKSGKIDVLSHPTNPDYDFEAVVKCALENNVLLELNLSYLKSKPGQFEKHKKLVSMHKDANKKMIVNSDAHFLHEIGDDAFLRKKWDELGMSEELIITKEELLDFLKQRPRKQ